MIDREEWRYSAPLYTLTAPADRPYVYLEIGGERVAELFVPGSVHPLAGRDDTTEIAPWEAEEGEETVFTLHCRSSVWEEKVYKLRCRPERVTLETVVRGTGRLAEVEYLGGYCSARPRWGSGRFSSGGTFTRVFNPEPNAEEQNYLPASVSTVIDLTGAPLPGKRHWTFTPAPFCFALETGASWIGLGVEPDPGQNRMTEYRYHGGDSFSLSLTYEGYTEVAGEYRLPDLGITLASSEFTALQAHTDHLRHAGKAPAGNSIHPAWWSLPMFCGWGAQCGLAAAESGYVVANAEKPDHWGFLSTMGRASSYARQDVYERFLAHLSTQGIRPGTVVLDDKWQSTYGENEVDTQKWPDLPGFVRARHGDGQHVLLWLKAWDPEGIPVEECIRNAAGLPLSVDPTNAAFEAHFRSQVRRMLSPEGYDADGFKIDFTHRIPSGPGMQTSGHAWGLELMRCYLSILYDEAKRVKPDALVMTHTAHPYLSDVLDMIRLNDMLDLTRMDDPGAGRDIESTVRFRARVAHSACPNALIDTDNWPVRDRETWRRYVALQPSIGVPSLYFSSMVDLTQEPLERADYDALLEAWNGIPGTR